MAVWILSGKLEGRDSAVLVDSVTMRAFGPLFELREEAEEFLNYLDTNSNVRDVRSVAYDRLTELVAEFRAEHAKAARPR